MKTVLITGASGFIGRHTLRPLLTMGFAVHAVTRGKPAEVIEGVTWHNTDLHDSNETITLLKTLRPSHLLHLAWHVPPGDYWTSPENARWVFASKRLFTNFFEAGGTRLVSAGTCAEYDWSAPAPFSEESTPLHPSTVYGQAKLELSQDLIRQADLFNQSSVWARLFYLYGPWEAPGRLVSSVIAQLLAGQTAACTEGSQRRDFMHVEDVARALALLIDRSDVKGAINVVSGTPVPIKDVVQTIASLIGRPDLLRLGALNNRPGDPMLLAGDGRRLQAMGFQPQMDLVTGLRQTVNWWKTRHIPA